MRLCGSQNANFINPCIYIRVDSFKQVPTNLVFFFTILPSLINCEHINIPLSHLYSPGLAVPAFSAFSLSFLMVAHKWRDRS